MCSFEGDLRVYFQCDGQDPVHLPDISIEVGKSLSWRLPAYCMTSSLDDACVDTSPGKACRACIVLHKRRGHFQCRDIVLQSQLETS